MRWTTRPTGEGAYEIDVVDAGREWLAVVAPAPGCSSVEVWEVGELPMFMPEGFVGAQVGAFAVQIGTATETVATLVCDLLRAARPADRG